MTDQTKFREAFLDLLADGEWSIEYDADTNDSGHLIDCSHFHFRVSLFSLKTFCDTIGIQPRYEQSMDEALQEAIEGERLPNEATKA